MILVSNKKYWLCLDMSGAVTLMRRDDFAAVFMPPGEEAKEFVQSIKLAQAGDPSGDSVMALYYAMDDRMAEIDPSGFLPLEIFFSGAGERFTADEVTGVKVIPTTGAHFDIVLQGPEGYTTATTAETVSEARRLGQVMAQRFKTELVDLASIHQSGWMKDILAGETISGFGQWLTERIGNLHEAEAGEFLYEGWMAWDAASDRPWWAPMGVADPVDDLNVYPSKAQCLEDDIDIFADEENDTANAILVRVLRGTGAIQVLDLETKGVFRELSRKDYYREFGMQLPEGVVRPSSAQDASMEP